MHAGKNLLLCSTLPLHLTRLFPIGVVSFLFLFIPGLVHGQCPAGLAISGDNTNCVEHNSTYNINYSSPTATFTWSLPCGGNIISGQGTNSIVVDWTTTVNPCTLSCSVFDPGLVSCFRFFELGAMNYTPTQFIGPTNVCAGGSYTYTRQLYLFEYPTGIGYSATGGTITNIYRSFSSVVPDQITVQWDASPGLKSLNWSGYYNHNGYDCSDQISYNVNLLGNAPAGTVNLGPDTSVCIFPVSLNAGSGFATYSWNTGASTQSINATASGTYSVITSGGLGCATDSVVVSSPLIPANPTITPAGPLNICSGQSVTLTASAGYNSYLWSNGATTSSITVGGTGNYRCTVTDFSGCQGTTPIVPVTMIGNPGLAINLGTSVNNCTSSTVNLSTSASNVSSYLWNTGATTSSIVVTQPGTYIVTGMNAACSTVARDTILVGIGMSPPTPVIFPAGPICLQSGNTVTLNAPTGYSSYLWSNGATTPSITVGTSGNYFVSVRNALGCQSANSASVYVNIQQQATILQGSSTCAATLPMTINALPTGTNTMYLWNNGGTSSALSITAGGIYTVTVTQPGCPSSSASINVGIQPTPPTVSAVPATLQCAGTPITLTASPGADGYEWSTGATTQSIVVSTPGSVQVRRLIAGCWSGWFTYNMNMTNVMITGGAVRTVCASSANLFANPSSGATYLWSTGQTTASIIGVTTSGIYSCTITPSGCPPFVASQNLTISPAPSAPLISPTGPITHCIPGSQLLNGPGGFNFYQWSSGQTTQNITVTSSSNYTLRVANTAGCLSPSSPATQVNFVAAPGVLITAMGPTTFCQGGSVVLASSLGNSYEWSTGATTSTISVTASGAYRVRVANVQGCWSAWSNWITVNVLTSPVATILEGSNVSSCMPGQMLTASPGASFLWNTGAVTPQIVVSTSGTYTVTVTATGGCGSAVASSTVSIFTPPPPPVITPAGPVNVCGGTPVTLTATPSGYSAYQWNSNESTESITPTLSGSYGARVQDANGCWSLISTPVVVNNNSAILMLPSTATTICPGGSRTLTASAGAGSYLWSTGATTASITVTTAGTYSVTFTATNGCVSTENCVVTAVAAPTVTVSASSLMICNSVPVTMDAGAGFSNYLWNTGESTSSISVTTAGTYTVTVSNANGCTASDSEVLIQGSGVVAITPVAPVICSGSSVTLDVGTGYDSYLWSTGATTQTISVSAGATYSVTVTSASGCGGTDSEILTVIANPTPSITPAAPTVCAGNSITLDVGAGYTSYLWNTGATTQTISASTAGTYSVTVTNANGCSGNDSEVLVVNASPTPSISPVAPTICAGNSITFNAGAGFTSYLWNTGATTQTISASTAGTYSVTVTNADGCSGNDSEVLVVDANPTPTISPVAPTICAGNSITLDAGAGFTSYLWSTGATTQTISASTAGTYSVTVTNANGCSGNDSEVLVVSASPTPSISPVAPTICAGNSVTFNAGAGFTSYLWSTGATTQTISASTAGTYSVTVTNAGGCSGNDSEVLVVNANPTVVITSPSNGILCNGTGAGLATLSATTGYSSYLWSTGATTSSISVASSGTYTVTATSSSGCTNSASYAVNVFTTCNTPVGLTSTSVQPTSAVVNWNITPCANKYRVYYKPAASPAWLQIILNAPATSTTLTNLAPNTVYQWRMRANCTGGGTSNYSATATFTTPPLRTADPGSGGEPAFKPLLFPNPNTGSFTLVFYCDQPKPEEVSIFDMFGKLIHRETFSAQPGENEVQINLASVSSGIYVLKVGEEAVRFQVDR